jgi:hypothetical protein
MTTSADLPIATHHAAQRIAFYHQLRQRLSSLAGVVAESSSVPLPSSHFHA